MGAKKPSPSSPTRSSAARSRAGSARAAAAGPAPRRSAPAPGLGLLERFHEGHFPASLYVEGPSEALKAAFLAELRRAWARACPESPLAHVFRAAESGVEEILAAFQGAS